MNSEGFYSLLESVSQGMNNIVNATLTFHKDCPRCGGSGKTYKHIVQRLAPLINHMADEFADEQPLGDEIDCPKCKGTGGIEMVATMNVTREPIKKDKKK